MANASADGGRQIDINTAEIEELTSIEGVDSERAQLIVAYREENGPFQSWDEFENVPGIGPALRAKAEAAASIGEGWSAEESLGAGSSSEELEDPEELDDLEESAELASEDEASPLMRESAELMALAQLDQEAAAAYELAAEHIVADDVREQLIAFRDDHLDHVRDIATLLEDRGIDLPEYGAMADSSAVAALAVAAGQMGTRAALLAMISNERLTNGTYESALLVTTDEEARGLLECNLADERRHLAWLEANKDRAFEASAEADASV